MEEKKRISTTPRTKRHHPHTRASNLPRSHRRWRQHPPAPRLSSQHDRQLRVGEGRRGSGECVSASAVVKSGVLPLWCVLWIEERALATDACCGKKEERMCARSRGWRAWGCWTRGAVGRSLKVLRNAHRLGPRMRRCQRPPRSSPARLVHLHVGQRSVCARAAGRGEGSA